jgi:hypothetical protein
MCRLRSKFRDIVFPHTLHACRFFGGAADADTDAIEDSESDRRELRSVRAGPTLVDAVEGGVGDVGERGSVRRVTLGESGRLGDVT